MFRELLDILRSRDPLRGAYDNLVVMVDTAGRMLDVAWQEALAGPARPEVADALREMDKEINRKEREIRRTLVAHAVTYGPGDLPACLALMSIIKDAERLGDYARQVLKAAGQQQRGVSACAARAQFQAAYEGVRFLISESRAALADGDAARARAVMLRERGVRADCDAVLEALLSQDLPSREGIPWALMTRYLKRMGAHASNLASSLVMPLHKLDFHDMSILSPGTGQGEA